MADAPPTTAAENPDPRLFPWVRLFRCAGVATDPKKLMLAALGLVLTRMGWAALGVDRPSPYPWDVGPSVPWEQAGGGDLFSPVPGLLFEPYLTVIRPFLSAFDLTPETRPFLVTVASALWAVVVWGLVGGAIARVSVVGLARGDRVGMLEALRFSMKKWRSLIGALFVPLLGIVVVSVPLALFGLLYRLGGSLGATTAGVLAFLPLLGGLVLSLVVLAPLLGWPLMVASVATQDEDAFDAVSRTYAYVHQRPWNYAAYATLAALIGLAGLVFVGTFARLAVGLAAWGLSFGGPPPQVRALFSGGEGAPTTAASAHRFWLSVVTLLVRGWAYSFFYTSACAIYLLLRRDVDGTPWSGIAHKGRADRLAETPVPSLDPAPTWDRETSGV